MPPKAAPYTVFKYCLLDVLFPVLPLHIGPSIPGTPADFLALIKGDNVRQDTTGDVLDLMLWNTGIIDELLPASQVVKFTSDFSVFVHKFLTDGSVIGWHGSFPRGNEKCRHLSSNCFLCVCKYFCFNVCLYYSKIGRYCQGQNRGSNSPFKCNGLVEKDVVVQWIFCLFAAGECKHTRLAEKGF